MAGLTYPTNQGNLPEAQIEWLDGNGAIIDFSTGWTFVLKIARQGSASPVLTKSSGIIGASTSPNVVVQWAPDELVVLTEGIWILQLAATLAGNTRYLTTTIEIQSTSPETAPCTYSGDPTTTPIDECRFLIGDTNFTSPLPYPAGTVFLRDAEIAYKIGTAGSVGMGAADCCEAIAAKLGFQVSGMKMVGQLKLQKEFEGQRQAWLTMAKTLRTQYRRLHPAKVSANPGALGAEFKVGMFDIFVFDSTAIAEFPTPNILDDDESGGDEDGGSNF